MSKAETITVGLTPEMAALLREAVAEGEYGSAEEAVQDALDGWRDRHTDGLPWTDEELRQLVEEGLASGPAEDGKVVMARILARFEAEFPEGEDDRIERRG